MALSVAIYIISDHQFHVKAQMIPPQDDNIEGPWEDEHIFGGLKEHKPGLKVRLAQNLSKLIKDNLLIYGQEYLNFDYKMRSAGVYKMRTFPFYMNIHFWDLHHSPISIDMEKFNFNFTHMVIDDEPVVYMQIPLIKEWDISFSYKYKHLGFIPAKGDVTISFRNVNALGTLKLKATQHGHLYPQLHDLVLDFGDTMFFEGNKWN